MPENGFASLNPPLTPDQRGSLSTRTTHPAFLTGLSDILSDIGVHADISNPFADSTKGEMFSWVVERAGSASAATFLGGTHSCAHTGHRTFGLSIRLQCGVCFGCLVRRSAFQASELKDVTEYLDPSTDERLNRYLQSKSMESAMREFVGRGVSGADIAAMSLPPHVQAQDALDLCRRAVRELSLLWS